MQTDNFSTNLENFSIDKLKLQLQKIDLLPSQQMLREDLEGRMALLKDLGYVNLKQLQNALKSKKDAIAFAEKTGLPEDYMINLRRWVNGYTIKPKKLADFPDVPDTVISALAEIGIKDTLELFPLVLNADKRKALAERVGADEAVILDLTKLADVSRLKWVGPKFARLMVESDYDTVEKVQTSDGEALYHHLEALNAERKIYKGGFGLADIKSWVKFIVNDVPRAIEY